MLDETLAWEHPIGLQCLYAPRWGVPTSYVLWFLHRICTEKKKSSLDHLGTLESFSKLLQLFFGTAAFYFLSFFIML